MVFEWLVRAPALLVASAVAVRVPAVVAAAPEGAARVPVATRLAVAYSPAFQAWLAFIGLVMLLLRNDSRSEKQKQDSGTGNSKMLHCGVFPREAGNGCAGNKRHRPRRLSILIPAFRAPARRKQILRESRQQLHECAVDPSCRRNFRGFPLWCPICL